MDKKSASGIRHHFKVIVGPAPLEIVGQGVREAVVFVNEGPAAVYCGNVGVPTGTWMYLPADQGFTDNYSQDAWYVRAATFSGTVSGWYV
jgi:hypothetical protein